jgi:hypothetical protein
VTFKDGSTTLGSGTLDGSGQATYSTIGLALGSHSITATYATDGNFNASTSSTLTQTVNKASSSVTVSSSANPSNTGQSVTFTATVSAVAPGSGTPTGTVTFKDGSTTLGSGTLNGPGQASYSISTLMVGSHSITATYGGDSNFTTSTSASLGQVVSSGSSPTPTPLSGQGYIAYNTVISNASYNSTDDELTFTITATIGSGSNQVVMPKTYKVLLRNTGG